MRYRAVARGNGWSQGLVGSVLVHDVRDASGAVRVDKGRILDDADVAGLADLRWSELHVALLEPDDIHEDEAGAALACAAAGEGVRVGERSAGHWPLVADRRGVVDVAVEALADVNALDGPAVYTLYHGHVVEEGEVVARASITPFALPRGVLEDAAMTAHSAQGLVRIRGFRPARLGAVVLDSLGERNPATIGRLATSLGEKARWLAAELIAPLVAEPNRSAVAAACGLFSEATVFDLVLPRLLAGYVMGGRELAALGHGGFLTRDMAYRFPPYRPSRWRGEVVD